MKKKCVFVLYWKQRSYDVEDENESGSDDESESINSEESDSDDDKDKPMAKSNNTKLNEFWQETETQLMDV